MLNTQMRLNYSAVLKYYSRVPVLLLRGLDCPLALHLVYELLRKSSPYWLETVNIMHGVNTVHL